MSQAAEAHDAWADVDVPAPLPSRRRRREADSWASAEDLEILGGLGEERVADWTVLTLERDEAAAEAPVVVPARRFERGTEPTEEVAVEPAPAVATPAAVVLPTHPEPESWLAEPPPARRPGERRTVVIRGQVAPRPLAPAERRRPPRRTRDRVGHRPDRVAMWAFALGVLLIVVAILTAGASG